MIWSDYVTWTATTAVYPPERALEYVTLGLLSEIGELAGKAKKRLRGDSVSDADIVAELGDCLWYCARLSAHCGHHWGMPKPIRMPVDLRTIKRALDLATCGKPVYCRNVVFDMGYGLGIEPSDLMAANVGKLEARLSRGTIKGSGDVR